MLAESWVSEAKDIVNISPVALGYTVRLLRAQRRLTQRQFADLAGFKPQHLSDIELGRVNPSLRTLDAVARALGIRASDLLAEAERYGRQG